MARLIRAGADVTLRNDDGRMPIHIAVDFGRLDDVRFLSQFYYEENIDIFVASMIGRFERITQILDDSPEQVNITDDYGSTPLMEAAFHDQVAVANLLLDRGAEPNVQNQGGITALHLATHPQIIEKLLSQGADPTIEDIKGMTPSARVPASPSAVPNHAIKPSGTGGRAPR
jgi:ankyrin repeat protein